MHELSICRSIARIATRHAGGRPVRRVRVRVGHLRQVVPDTLAGCWELLTDGTELAGAVLEVEEVPAVVACRDCGARTTLDSPRFRCGSCGGTDLVVVAGEELLVTSLDVTEA